MYLKFRLGHTSLPLLGGPQQWVLNILAEGYIKEELQVGNQWFLLGNLCQLNNN